MKRREGDTHIFFSLSSFLIFVIVFFPFQYESVHDSDDESEESDGSEKKTRSMRRQGQNETVVSNSVPPPPPSLLFSPLSFFIASRHLVYSC